MEGLFSSISQSLFDVLTLLEEEELLVRFGDIFFASETTFFLGGGVGGSG